MCFLLIRDYNIYTYVILYLSVLINDFSLLNASKAETDSVSFFPLLHYV